MKTETKQATPSPAKERATTTVALAWATKKRHIAINGAVLCEPKIQSAGYSVRNGQYNTLALSGVPDYPKTSDDVRYSHGDGMIEFKPLNDQPTVINEQSVCKQCQRRYERVLRSSS